MQLQWHLLLSILSYLTSAASILPRSASFSSLIGLTRLTRDHSEPQLPTHPGKFFREATFDRHYDGRFTDQSLSPEVRRFHLRLLLKSYMDTMDRIGVKTWLMHGCLLGWFWNGQIMPWDADVDVMVDERSIHELGTWYNMTVHHFYASDFGLADASREEHGEEEEVGGARKSKSSSQDRDNFEFPRQGKKYLLEVNPHYAFASPLDRFNVIDARWIDTITGLYIDITAVHPMREQYRAALTKNNNKNEDYHASTSTTDSDEDTTELYTKDKHIFHASDLFPLRSTSFESTTVNVPYAYEQVLLDEYGHRALTDTWFDGYGFDTSRKEWVRMEPDEQQQLLADERVREKGGRAAWALDGGRVGRLRGSKRRKMFEVPRPTDEDE